MTKRVSLGLMIFVALLMSLVAGVVLADHSWNGYHWPSDNLSPAVVDKTKASLYDVPAVVTEWADLGTPIGPTLAARKKGKITVSEASSAFWLGLARVFVEDGHITRGEVKLNTQLLVGYGATAADHVLCQEIGYVLGLEHNRNELDTCMNDQATLGSAASPNAHDTEQLNLIYNHTGATSGGGKGKGGNKDGVNKDGRWITVHVFPAP